MALSIEERRELNRLEQESLDLESRGLTLENEKLSRLRELRDLRGEELRDQESSVEYQEQILRQLNDRIDKAKIIQQQGVEVTGIYREQLSVTEKLLDIQEKELDVNAANYETELARIAAARDELAIKRKGYNDAEGFAKRFAGITKEPTSEFGKLLVGGGARLEGLVSGLGDVITPMSIMSSTIDKVVEASVALALEQDQAVVNFRRATGASGEFDDNIRGLERSLFTAGVSAAEAGQSVQTLFLNVTDFTNMSDAQQTQLAETTAVLNELGVAADNTAKNIQFATKALGMSTSQAEELQRELFTFAQDLGVSADKIAQDFQKFGPQIAALGSKGVEAFKQLEMQAKATGLAIDELVNITEQFNKFDTAAQAVGKLNAMLGGPFLNSLQMVNETNPAKRMELLKNAVDKAGLSFNTMDFYQRKAIASSMGLNEQQLALVMRGNFNVGPPPKTAEQLADLQEQTIQFNTLMEEMMQMGKALAISFGPFVDVLKVMLDFMSNYGKSIMFATGVLGLYHAQQAGVFFMLRTEGVASIMAMSTAEKGSLFLGGAMIFLSLLGLIPEKFRGLAIAIGLVTAAVVALSLAEKSTVILGAVGLVIAGIGGLVHAFTVGNSPSLVEAFMMVAAAIPFMTLAMLGLMPLLPALMLMVPPLVFAFVMLADAMSEIISDQFVNNLQLMAVEIANIVASINELSATKAVAFTATMAATTTAAAATALTGGALAAVVAAPAAAPAAAPDAAAAAPTGPPPTININLSIDGNEFATVVNSVEVSKYGGGSRSSMYDSIIGMIEQGLVKG